MKHAELGFAKPHRALGMVSNTGLQIESRAADYLEHVSGGSLLLQRFGELRPSLGEFAPAYFKLLLHIARRLARLTKTASIPPSFRSNEACDQAFGSSRPCETRSPPQHLDRPRLSWPPTSKT